MIKFYLLFFCCFKLIGMTPADYSVKKHQISNDAKVARRLYVDQIQSNGGIIILSDGSTWMVAPTDRDYTSMWLGPADVVIKKRKKTNNEFGYTMTNTWTKKTVLVKKLT